MFPLRNKTGADKESERPKFSISAPRPSALAPMRHAGRSIRNMHGPDRRQLLPISYSSIAGVAMTKEAGIACHWLCQRFLRSLGRRPFPAKSTPADALADALAEPVAPDTGGASGTRRGARLEDTRRVAYLAFSVAGGVSPGMESVATRPLRRSIDRIRWLFVSATKSLPAAAARPAGS